VEKNYKKSEVDRRESFVKEVSLLSKSASQASQASPQRIKFFFYCDGSDGCDGL
jgi:hypothetical protein